MRWRWTKSKMKNSTQNLTNLGTTRIVVLWWMKQRGICTYVIWLMCILDHFLLAVTMLKLYRNFSFFMNVVGEKWSSFSVLSCDERYSRSQRGQAAHDGSPHRSWCLLLRLPWGAWLEVWASLRGNTEVQGREVHTWEVKNSRGKLVVPTKSSAYLSLCKFKCIDASMCLSYPKNSHQLEIFNHCSLLCILGYSL